MVSAMCTIEVRGLEAQLHYDPEIRRFHGEVRGERDRVTFYGASVDELEAEAGKSLDHYLASCERRGIEPELRPAG